MGWTVLLGNSLEVRADRTRQAAVNIYKLNIIQTTYCENSDLMLYFVYNKHNVVIDNQCELTA